MGQVIGNEDNTQTVTNNANENLLKVGVTLNKGRYRIVNFLASGGFGNTYVAYDTSFDTLCAIKEFFIKGDSQRDKNNMNVVVSNPDKIQMFNSLKDKFDREARRLYAIRSEHVVSVHDRFAENNTSYYTMDLIEGQALSNIMKKEGKPFPEQKVIEIIAQMLDALKAIHEENLLHMDVKPANILVNKQGKYVLIDFGASKQSENVDGMTTSTAMAYTPGFAPTEQTSGTEKRWGPWTDIYALGATAYNLLTGKRPPVIDDIMEDGEQAFKYPENVSQYMKKMISWMMQPVGKNRPQSADEIIDSPIYYKISVLNQPIVRNEEERLQDSSNKKENEDDNQDTGSKEKKIFVGDTEIIGKTQKETEIQKNGYTISPVKNNQDIRNAKISAKEHDANNMQLLTRPENEIIAKTNSNRKLKIAVFFLTLALIASIAALVINVLHSDNHLQKDIQVVENNDNSTQGKNKDNKLIVDENQEHDIDKAEKNVDKEKNVDDANYKKQDKSGEYGEENVNHDINKQNVNQIHEAVADKDNMGKQKDGMVSGKQKNNGNHEKRKGNIDNKFKEPIPEILSKKQKDIGDGNERIDVQSREDDKDDIKQDYNNDVTIDLIN